MPVLRLTVSAAGGTAYRVEIALEEGGLPRQTAVSTFSFALTDQQQEDLRWYLEDFLVYPLEPAPAIARRIEADMARIGVTLFESIFGDGDARDLWTAARPRLGETRVEVSTGVNEATAIPWELMRDPKTDAVLALQARSFVRSYSQPAQPPVLPKSQEGPVRILLVICRPGGAKDVPFRSVASRLIKGLNQAARQSFELEVLRPPAFEQLGRKLRAAAARGEPYHVLHFDGHGAWCDASGLDPALLVAPARTGEHGYLSFENAAFEENEQLVDGPALGRLMAETATPVLILNACRSAHAEPPPAPAGGGSNPHADVRAFGSVAQEVMDAGAVGVVAMRYNVFVDTAAQFAGELYANLAAGHSLGEAVSLGRKQLAGQPLRQIAFDARPLQDWMVPVVYEAAPVALFPPTERAEKLTITLGAGDAPGLDAALPARPDAGFYGRDETLLALDRAFDTQSVVLLHAYAGSGKTATAGEFARWYWLTGGVKDQVLFTSFQHHTPLARVLDQIGQRFGQRLERAGVHWLALPEAQRRDVALQVLQQAPVLWIWDNVEPVAGFPRGAPSAWSEAEQKELADFLRAAGETKAKFLLTSRRDERDWLKGFPFPVKLPPMPMQEMIELTRALAEKRGRRFTDVEDWRPLLRFTQGNPLTITVLAGQALRDGIRTKEQVEAFVERLRAGEAVFEDEVSEGRTRSLGASLSYGFDHAFTDAERKRLALLHLFQGFV
ncbi:MAG: CHAT domain-containing protein, partial [Acidobacteriota bacterium]